MAELALSHDLATGRLIPDCRWRHLQSVLPETHPYGRRLRELERLWHDESNPYRRAWEVAWSQAQAAKQRFTRVQACGNCAGEGLIRRVERCGRCDGNRSVPVACPTCRGSGTVVVGGTAPWAAPSPAYAYQDREYGICPTCAGRGEVVRPCERCRGAGVTTLTKKCSVCDGKGRYAEVTDQAAYAEALARIRQAYERQIKALESKEAPGTRGD